MTLALAGCAVTPVAPGSPAPGRPSTGTPSPPATMPPPIAPAKARRFLAKAREVERHPVTAPYDRDAFGTSWSDTDGNGCNQRDDVLLRDARPGSTRTAPQGACDHDVLAGIWIDPYTGKKLRFTDLKDPSQAQGVQIDHIVPLAEAWIAGASGWTDERRHQFANDLRVLVASDGPTNASKGDDDPAAWRPKAAYQCAYAVRWIMVKHRWNLGIDDSERAALLDMLSLCKP